MTIEILEAARVDLLRGADFYDSQRAGLGDYFLECLSADIEALLLHAGVHQIIDGYHRSLSKRFPYAIYYRVVVDDIRVYAVLDCRRSPERIRNRLAES